MSPSEKPWAVVMTPEGRFYESRLAWLTGVLSALEASGMTHEADEFLRRASQKRTTVLETVTIAGEYVRFKRSNVM